jgi:PadR family transcriptional regulator, regulatory protein AphA
VARKKVTTTSFAVLGLLALRPWSGYELTKQVQRSLRYFWPKSESLIYSEPPHLVDQGLAEVTREGRKKVYAITPRGREALEEWLRSPVTPPELEFEAMLRLAFADQVSREDVLEAIGQSSAWARARYREAQAQVTEYLADGGPFPARLHLVALFADFYDVYLRAVINWCDRATEEVSSWPGTSSLGMTPGARKIFETIASRTVD